MSKSVQSSADHGPHVPLLVRMLAWAAAYFLAGQVDLAAVLEGHLLRLVSPSAGVAVVWFATGSRRTWPWDTVALVVASLVLNVQLGAPGAQILLGTLGSVLQVGLFVVVMRRWSPDLIFFGGVRDTWRVRDLWVFLAAGIAAAILPAVGTTLGQALAGLPGGDMESFLVRWGRNSSAIVAIGSAGLLVAAAIRRARLQGARADEVLRAVLPATHFRWAECLGLALASAAAYWLAFAQLDQFPLTWLLFVVTVWVGARFTPTTIAVHGLLVGTAAVWFTLQGHGIFAGVGDLGMRAVIAQLFVLVMSATGLVIGLERAERIEAERLSEERAQLLDSVLREVRDGIAVIEEGGQVLVFNPAAQALLGVGPTGGRLAPGGAGRLLDSDGLPAAENRLPHVRALEGEEVRGEELHVRSGREERILRVNAHVLPAVPGDERRALVSYLDITEDRRHRDALVLFAGHVAHDLKSPLTIIEGWAESLADAFEASASVDSSHGLSMTRRIEGAAVQMREFIRELLDYTLARDQSLRPDAVNLIEVADSVASTHRDASGANGSTITVVGGGTAWADPVLVRIVLDNLIGNACKYVAPNVHPVVSVTVADIGQSISVAVTDNGIGIAEDQRSLVFDSFHRVPQAGYSGTGLGLAICHRIVERHGGELSVDSAPGGTGSCFRFTLQTPSPGSMGG